MKREGIKRMWAGGLLFFIVAPAVFVVAVLLGVRGAINAVDSAERISPGGTVQLEAGERVALFVFDSFDTSDFTETDPPGSDSSGDDATCVVTDPSGAPANLSRNGGNSEISDSGSSYEYTYDLTAGPAGAYRITCGTQEVLVMDEGVAELVGRGVAVLILGLALPFVIGVLGFALFIWGLVKRNSSKREAFAYGGAAYAGQHYQQPGGYPYAQPGYDQQQHPPAQSYGQAPYGSQGQPYGNGQHGSSSWGGEGGGYVGGDAGSGSSGGGFFGGGDSGGSSGGGGDSGGSSGGGGDSGGSSSS